MPSNVAPSPDLVVRLDELSQILGQSVRVVDLLIGALVSDRAALQLRKETQPIPDEVSGVVAIMLQALGSSCNTLRMLTKTPGLPTRDCYSIARCILELAVNISYIMAEGPVAALRAQRHARQKAFRDLDRESEIAGSVVRIRGPRPDPSDVPGIQADLDEFTGRRGREKDWTDLTLNERIAVVGRSFGGSVLGILHGGRAAIYGSSSEILHGSFYSALLFFGLTAPFGQRRTLQQAVDFVASEHMMLLVVAIMTISAVVESFDKAYGFSAALRRSEELIETVRKLGI